MKPSAKNDKAKQLLKENFMYEYYRTFTEIPNNVDGEILMQQRNDTLPDMEFDKIISISHK
jgi:hypothetical protein